MIQAERISEILLDERGTAWIAGRNTKVEELVREHLAYGWKAEKLREEHPHLTLGEIHAALSYYYDHRPAFETIFRQSEKEEAALRAGTENPVLQQRLRAAAARQ